MSPNFIVAAVRVAKVLAQPSSYVGGVSAAIGTLLKLSPSQNTQVAGDIVLFASLFLLAVDDGTNTAGK